MKFQLIKDVNSNYSALQQILTNRGIKLTEINHYLNTTDNDIESFNGLGPKSLKDAAAALTQTIKNNSKAIIIVD